MNLEEAKRLTTKLAEKLSSRAGKIGKYEKYFRGEQPLAYASDEWKKFHNSRFDGFSDNWCGVVGSAPAERLKVTGFRLDKASPEPITPEEKQLFTWWQRNEMESQASQGFLQSIISGRSFILVWGDEDGNPVTTWEDPEQVIVDYNPATRARTSALKVWEDGSHEFAALYTPDEVWTFKRRTFESTGKLELPRNFDTRAWEPDGEVVDNPLGEVPIIEVQNRPMLKSDPLSDIQGTMAMQDAINLLWAYLFSAADYASMPARVVMGQEPPKMPVLDENGQIVGEKPIDIEQLTKGRMLYLTGQNTSIGQWEAARLDVFTDVVNVAVKHVAAQSRTPIHYIVGELNNVNGETLLAGETGLVKKVEDFQTFANPAIRDYFRLCALAADEDDLSEACRLGSPLWADAQTRTQAQASDAALKDRQVGFSFQTIAETRYGLSPDQVEREMERRRQESELLFGDVPDLSVKQDDDGLAVSGALES